MLSKFKFKREGVTWKYHGDLLLYRWPWLRGRSNGYPSKFKSISFKQDFNSFKDYWYLRGKFSEKPYTVSNRAQGFSMEALLERWISCDVEFYDKILVVLSDIEVSSRSIDFWKSLGPKEANLFTRDLVILVCKDLDQGFKLVESISKSFANAWLINNGQVLIDNDRDTNE